jgi:hypothetical protein
MVTLVRIGTNDVWSPPRRVLLALGDDWVITNVTAPSWRLAEKATVTRVAVAWRDSWRTVTMAPLKVDRGQDAILARGALRIDVREFGDALTEIRELRGGPFPTLDAKTAS